MRVELEFSEDTLSSLRQTPDGFASEMRLAAAAKWYELGRLSQEQAAAVAGLSRADFIDAMRRLGVAAIQATPEELRQELDL